jgi:AraC-like DNA-binding protein/ligand-binding sensor protein
MDRHENKDLIESLAGSKIFEDYERAFSEATGLPVSLRPVESWQLPNHGKRNENPLCAIMADKSRACASCLQVQHKLSESARFEPATITCHTGFCDTAVPVRLGEQLIGFLQTGQVLRKKATTEQIDRTAKLVADWGINMPRERLESIYGETRTLTPKQYDSMVKLLSIFAEHLSLVTNQIVVRQRNNEPAAISKAKEFIMEHQAEDISLGQTAKAVNTSTFHFCKLFKKATGLRFTEYVSRLRVEKARNLLLNPNLRISEIAYEVGFQSLTHFNRVFKKIAGQSPSEFRAQLVN